MAAIALMCLVSAAWLSYQSWRYFAVPQQLGGKQISRGAIDVKNRYDEVRSWFGREPVYWNYPDAVYPPASYALLGIAFNGLGWEIVKPLWYLLSLVSAALLSRQLMRCSLAQSRLEQVFLRLMPFAFYATGAALGNGQLVLFVLPLVLNAVLLLHGDGLKSREHWLGSLSMLCALVQPTIAAPFFWLVMFVVPTRRPAALIVALYVGLTAFAVLFQIGVKLPEKTFWELAKMKAATATEESSGPTPTRPVARVWRSSDKPGDILNIWAHRARGGVSFGSRHGGYASVHAVLAALDLSAWNVPVSLAILLVLGAWTFRNRRADVWLLLGVTAIVARIWTYHRWYDDLLLIVPLITLFRITKLPQFSTRTHTLAAVLFFWIWLFLLAPGVLYTFRSPDLPVAIQVSGWMAALVFLVYQVDRERCRMAA